MKVNVTEEELQRFDAATRRGAIEGTLGGLAISLPLSYLAYRRFPAYRALPPSLKALGIVLIVGPAIAIQTERRGVEFDENVYWTGATRRVLDSAKSHEESKWRALSTREKITHWARQNQYKVILGSWAIGMAIAGGIVMRDRHQSTSQKVVQARMWAQGLTIGVLIGAGILTHSQREQAAGQHSVDHSWKDVLEAEAKEEEQRKIGRLHAPAL
ncbi:hypothetical protein EW146_g1470 [Bondarzewia mesenterica]|uniref:HIG1 domain-containing protein n=1 Tax=Bondarzewia mesenterica TaxID=1095465 RepID=A0A4S4M3T7_9AGAM|nr:hypothetical protein EW146_g1470 [Bondarzewia mesenterica]